MRLIGFAALLVAGLVLGILLAAEGEPREALLQPSAAATPASAEAAGEQSAGADAAVSSPAAPTTLRYNLLDTTGAATGAGSYAFLQTAGDAASAIGNFGYSASGSAELRIHPTDASGASRAAFYDTVQVGDSFDYRTDGLDCGFRFKVTSVAAATSARTFGLEHVTSFGAWCDFVDDPAVAKDVHFVWRVRPGIEGPDGVRLLLGNEPAGEGTYRLYHELPYIFDVPAGMQVIHDGLVLLEPAADAPADAPSALVWLIDAETGSELAIDPRTGREIQRVTTSHAIAALFDQIIASIRRVDGPASPPEPVTLRYNLLDISGAATATSSYAFLKTAGDAASAISNFGASAGGSVELRINSTDATGASRAAFFDTVQVGDSFDYRTNGLGCAFRFKVTGIGATANPKTFEIVSVRDYGGQCGVLVDDPTAAKDVEFVWAVGPGIPRPDGVRTLLPNEPTGAGTYRLEIGLPYVIDVPAGMQVIHDGLYLHGHSGAEEPRAVVILTDAATGSQLDIDVGTGKETYRRATTPEVSALFDQIMASIRVE